MMSYNYSTPRQTLFALREKFRSVNKIRAAKIAEWVLTQSDEDIKDAFGIGDVGLTILKNRLQQKVDALNAIRNIGGEE